MKDVINGGGGGEHRGKTRGGMEGNVTLIALDPGDLIMCSAPSPPSITHTYTHTQWRARVEKESAISKQAIAPIKMSSRCHFRQGLDATVLVINVSNSADRKKTQ